VLLACEPTELTMPEKKEDRRKLYFIAIMPPSPLVDEALKLKQYVADNYASKGALNSPPHITLHMPFEWREDREEKLMNKLVIFSATKNPLRIEFDNFGCFAPRVIFINIKKSEPLERVQRDLNRFCRQELNLFNANYKELPFHPHLTIAFRDLKKQAFHKAWEEFQSKLFEGEFMADHIVLLKHSGKIWEVFKTFKLGDGRESKIND
jgi:2'-5' RNA ligase